MSKEDIFTVLTWFIAICLGVGFLMFIGNHSNNFTEDLDKCLEPIAKEYCKAEGMVYLSEESYVSYFYCFKDERASMGERFNFLNEEIENCRQFALGEQDG